MSAERTWLEEGDPCPNEDCEGRMIYPKVENCTCFINPPCGACTDNQVECEICGEQDPEWEAP